MITDLLTVPALGLPNLIDDFIALTSQNRHLVLSLFLPTSKTNGCIAEVSKKVMIVLGKQLDLLFSKLCLSQEIQVLFIQTRNCFIVLGYDHTITDFDALVCQ